MKFSKVRYSFFSYSFLLSALCAASLMGEIPVWTIVSGLLSCLFPFFFSPKVSRLIANILAPIALVFIVKEFKSILSVEAALSFLMILVGLKCAEAKNKRDMIFHNHMIFILSAGSLLFSQSLLMNLYIVLIYILTLTSIQLIDDPSGRFLRNIKSISRQSLKYFLIAIPLTIILFFLFPRMNISLNRFAKISKQSGFSPNARPSSGDEIQLDDSKVFKAIFSEDFYPPLHLNYWVGAVLYQTNGFDFDLGQQQKTTLKKFTRNEKLPSGAIKYEVIGQAPASEYFFTLDTFQGFTNSPSGNIQIWSDKMIKLNRLTPKKLYFQAVSTLGSKKINITEKERKASLQFPRDKVTPKLIELGKSLKGLNPEGTVANILSYFKREQFKYTLKPGENPNLSHFLFTNKKGFCVHFASAMTILARLTGLPSRVIVGYHGGKRNDISNSIQITERDAHAWSEVFIPEKGWVRYDPVQAVAPARINLGGSNFFAVESFEERENFLNRKIPLWKELGLTIAANWDFIDTRWQQFLIQFDRNYQSKLARFTGVSLETYYIIGVTAAILILLLVMFYFRSKENKASPSLSAEVLLYQDFCLFFTKKGLPKENDLTPLQYANFLEKKLSSPASNLVKQFLQSYSELRYIEYKTSTLILLNKTWKELKKMRPLFDK